MPRTQHPTRPPRRSKRRTREQKFLEQVHLNAAGIDIGSGSHWVAVPTDRDEQPVREFRSFTHALIDLADWLTACDIDTVAMESSGVYWIPLYEMLEARGFTVLLVNARHVKNVPGRKSDVSDCQWIQRLHTFGLLRGSFRPTAEITAIRTLLRHRDTLVEGAAACIQRMQKALTLMNLQLHTVISDVTGVTGMLILRDSVAGMTDPAVLARHRHPQCRASEAEIAASLTGHSRDEHLFVLRQELEVYDCCHEKIRRGDEQIETRVHALQAQCEPPGRARPASRKPSPKSKRQDNTPSFEIRSPLFTLCGGVDLTALPGLGPYGALRLISEIGVDMHCWPTEHHFASWLTLAPNNRISGGEATRVSHAAVSEPSRQDPAPRRHGPRSGRPRARGLLPPAGRSHGQAHRHDGDRASARPARLPHAHIQHALRADIRGRVRRAPAHTHPPRPPQTRDITRL